MVRSGTALPPGPLPTSPRAPPSVGTSLHITQRCLRGLPEDSPLSLPLGGVRYDPAQGWVDEEAQRGSSRSKVTVSAWQSWACCLGFLAPATQPVPSSLPL